MEADEAKAERERLVDASLRITGADSRFVQEHGLSEYLEDEAITSLNAEVLAEHGKTEASKRMAAELPGILDEFGFDKKFPGMERPNIPVAVLPNNAPERQRKAFPGSAAIGKLPDGTKVMVANEYAYHGAVEERGAGSRSLLAHEAGHALRDVTIVEGPQRLGHMFNELLAEWSGDNHGGYFTEKHMVNLLSLSGFDFRGDYLPKLASGEMAMPQFIAALKGQVGARNALRLLMYAPQIYETPDREQPADLVQDCVIYRLQHGMTAPGEISSRLQARYNPELSRIMVTNREIRSAIPPILYDTVLRRAREDPRFDERHSAQPIAI